jgi:hypothetical protein
MKLFKLTYKSSFSYLTGEDRRELRRGSYNVCEKALNELSNKFYDLRIEKIN